MKAILIALTLLALRDDPDVRVALGAGDAAAVQMDYDKAAQAYEVALRAAPEDPDALWRMSRVFVLKGEVAEGEDRKKLLTLAEEYGRRCIARDSSSSEGHAWLAGALGYLALDAGPSDQVRFAHEIVREANAVLKLNPADDKAYSILGSLYRALGNVGWVERQVASLLWGGLPDGGFPEAEVAFKKAIRLSPDVMRHQYELGVLYMDMDRYQEARAALETARTLPIRVAIDLPRLKKIDELLAKIRSHATTTN